MENPEKDITETEYFGATEQMDQSNLDLELELDFEDPNTVTPSNSLEFNLILCFIYKSA